MGTQLSLGLLMLMQVTSPNVTPSPTTPQPKAPEAVVVKAPPRCDARPYQRLVGRTVGDLLTARVPPNTRIYRLDDPQTQPLQSGRLSVELNRSTRVRRIYCS
jgi:hypothetical protein